MSNAWDCDNTHKLFLITPGCVLVNYKLLSYTENNNYDDRKKQSNCINDDEAVYLTVVVAMLMCLRVHEFVLIVISLILQVWFKLICIGILVLIFNQKFMITVAYILLFC